MALRPQSLVWSLLAAWLWLWSGSAFANPDIRWRTIESEHFYVHYWAGQEEAADRVIMVAERAYDHLSVAWGHHVYLKTHITLTDLQDSANGLASSIPYPRITAYVTAPEAMSVLEAYDDWLDVLITHEFVHVVHLDTIHGLYRVANAVLGFGVLGHVTAPNLLQPRWVIEGVATTHESKYTSQGRRHSAQFDAYLRMAVLEGTFQSLDQVSSGARIWPHGTSVYLYGLHFMHYISARFGTDTFQDLSHIYARQFPPYGINRAIKNVTGLTFYQLWKEFKDDITLKYKAQARRIRARGLRQGRRLTFGGEQTRYPVWGPDDEYVYFFKDDGHRQEGFKRIRSTGGRLREGVGIGRQGADVDIEHIFDIQGVSAGTFVPGSGDVIFDLTGVYDYRYRWSDLYRWNGGDPKKAEQLTFGARAMEPHVSPDGRTVVFRRNDVAQSRLGFVTLDTAEISEVAPRSRVSQVYTPRWHPDGNRVAYSGWEQGGYRDILIYHRDTGDTEQITEDRFVDMSPTWSPDGRYLVFVSDRDDVFNLYAYDTETHQLHQVSNVLGGAFEPAISHDGTRIAYIGYTSEAFDVWVMPFEPSRWLPVGPGVGVLVPARTPKPPLPNDDGRAPTARSKRYQPGRTFFPRTFMPAAFDVQSSEFASSFGIETGISDVLSLHSLSLNLNYDFTHREPAWSAVYRFNRLWPDFTLVASSGFTVRGNGFRRFDYEHTGRGYDISSYRERFWRFRAAVGLPVVSHPRHRASIDVAYQWTRWSNLDASDLPIDPNAPISSTPSVGDAAEIQLGATYTSEISGGGRFTFGSEQGRRASFDVSVIDPALGGDFQDVAVGAFYREIVSMPWRGHQSLVLLSRGAMSLGGARRGNSYCVGDYFPATDIFRNLLTRVPNRSGCSALIRGYAPAVRRGRYYAAGTVEYRIPLLDVDRGLGTVPLFMQRIGLVPFFDVGNAWNSLEESRDVLIGTGAGLYFVFEVGYVEGISLLLQYAHGFHDELGLNTFRAVVSTAF